MLWRRLNQKANKLVSDSWQGHLLSCPRQLKKGKQISIFHCCRITGLVEWIFLSWTDQQFIQTIHTRDPPETDINVFFWDKQKHCFISLPLQPFHNWKSTFVCHSNHLINIHLNSIESNLWRESLAQKHCFIFHFAALWQLKGPFCLSFKRRD